MEIEGLKCYRYHSTNVYIDEGLTRATMLRQCPGFFEQQKKGERLQFYRGHVIVTGVFQASDRSRSPYVLAYAYDVRRQDTYNITVDAKSVKEAKELIDEKLDSDEPPFILKQVEVEMSVPVKVLVDVFEKPEGGMAGAEITKFLHVGKPDQRQQPLPGDTFTTACWTDFYEHLPK